MSRAGLAGRVVVGAMLLAAAGLATMPFWGDTLFRSLVPDDAYSDTYYVVVRFDVIFAGLAMGLLAGLALIAWGRRHD